MMNASRSAASQLVVVSLVACLCAACPPARAQTSPRAPDRTPDAAARQGGGAAHGVRLDPACNHLFDGRGEKVLVRGAGGQAGTFNKRECPVAQTTQPGPVEANSHAKTVEANSPPKPVEAKSQPKPVEPPLQAPAITAGSVQGDPASARDPGPRTQAARPVSVGRLSATLVTGSTAVFLLHSSLWTYLLILGLPLWQHVDLLPIVDRADDDEDPTAAPDADEERAVSRVLATRGPRRGSGGGPG
jgi:hypothetical protein